MDTEQHSKDSADCMPKQKIPSTEKQTVNNKSRVYTNPFPENNKLPLRNVLQDINEGKEII